MFFQTYAFQQHWDSLLPVGFAEAVEPRVQIQKLRAVQPVVEAEVLRQEAHARSGLRIANRLAQQPRLAARRLRQAQQHFDRGRFARAVRAKKAEHFARPT
jgi:hypothetical protein